VEDFLWSKKDEFLVRDLYSFFGENSAFTTIVLAQEDLPDAVLKELRQKIRKAMPPIGGARVYFREEAEEGGSTTYFSVRLFGNDVEGLNQWAEVVARKLQAIEGVEDVVTSARRARREVQGPGSTPIRRAASVFRPRTWPTSTPSPWAACACPGTTPGSARWR
jgi:multidrug efflux pump subunit AcrB